MLSLIIKNGTVFDGTGEKRQQVDIGILGDKIKEIGNLKEEKAEKVVDAKGMFVVPGFVDIQNHSDGYLTILSNPGLESYLSQGITTIIGGQCGSSLAPLTSRESFNSIRKWADIRGVNFSWLTVTEYLDEIERLGIAVNFGTMVGHSTLRRGLIGDEPRKLTAEELEIMAHSLSQALEEGALGFSTGLVYSHANFVIPDEIAVLVKKVKEYGKLYSTHLRNEGAGIVDSVMETIEIANVTGANVEISHLKVEGESFWKKMDEILLMISKQREEGTEINFDVYPYPVTASVMYTLLPRWVGEGGRRAMLGRLQDEKKRIKLLEEMKSSPIDYAKLLIAHCPYNPSLVGLRMDEIAIRKNVSTDEAVLDVMLAGMGHVICFNKSISEANLNKAMVHPDSIISSDSAGYNTEYGRDNEELVHPRAFGTFPRFLGRYVREKEIMPWEEAIRKITYKPAKKIGLKGRGVIKENAYADIVVFDPEKIIDRADFMNPYQYSEGIKHTIVNGVQAYTDGVFEEELLGQVLRY